MDPQVFSARFFFLLSVATYLLSYAHAQPPKPVPSGIYMKTFVSPRAALRKNINKGGGTCGYEGSFDTSPRFGNGLTMYLPPSVYKKGAACGTCISVTCSNKQACKGKLATTGVWLHVVGLAKYTTKLQLSDVAWEALVNDQKRENVEVQFKAVPCNATASMAVRVISKSKKDRFAINILGTAGMGIKAVEISNDGSRWVGMERKDGMAAWMVNKKEAKSASTTVLRSGKPLSVRATAEGTDEKVVLDRIIPADWAESRVYPSNVNFRVPGAKPAVFNNDASLKHVAKQGPIVDKAKVESAVETIKATISKASTEVSAAIKSAFEAIKGIATALKASKKPTGAGDKAKKDGEKKAAE